MLEPHITGFSCVISRIIETIFFESSLENKTAINSTIREILTPDPEISRMPFNSGKILVPITKK